MTGIAFGWNVCIPAAVTGRKDGIYSMTEEELWEKQQELQIMQHGTGRTAIDNIPIYMLAAVILSIIYTIWNGTW